MKFFTLTLLLFTLSTANAALLTRLGSFIQRKKQPLRCVTATCKPFSAACGGDNDCVSGKCFNGKCGLSETCRPAGEACKIYSEHTCCTGKCQPLMLRSDCKRLLKIPLSTSSTKVEKLHCDDTGVCGEWDGEDSNSFLTQPWSVDVAKDKAAKYFMFKSITFEKPADTSVTGLSIDNEKFADRKVGRLYKNIDVGTTKPATISDAGTFKFAEGTYVDKKKFSFFVDNASSVTYCIAPVVDKEGHGGGFFAVGKNCCGTTGAETDTFDCALGDEGIVVSNDREKYASAQLTIEGSYGRQIHCAKAGYGVETQTPFFLRMVPDAIAEQGVANPAAEYHYVPLTQGKTCVAPLVSAADSASPYQFWAAGTGSDCGDSTIKKCGKGEIVSGLIDQDLTGDFRMTALIAEMKYGLKSEGKPLFVECSSEVLVENPEG